MAEEKKNITKFFEIIKKDDSILSKVGYNGTFSDLTRFIARLNIAKKLKSIRFHDIKESTEMGYLEYLRLFLVFSAFEDYMRLINNYKRNFPYKDAKKLINKSEGDMIINEIRSLGDKSLFNFLEKLSFDSGSKELNNKLKAFNKNDYINTIYLAAAIRHAFVHGILTPNVENANPKKVVLILSKLSKLIIQAINDDFDKKIELTLKFEKQENLTSN